MHKQRTVTNQHCRCCNGIYKTNKWHATGILRARYQHGSAIRTSQSGREEPQQLGLQPALNRRRVPSPHQWNDHTKPKTKANAEYRYRHRQATVPRQHPQFRSCANIHSYVYPSAAGYNAVYCLGRTEQHTCCIVFARANRERPCCLL